MSNVVCPTCREKISIENVNMEEGVALCRSCKSMYKIATCLDVVSAMKVVDDAPPRGCTVVSDGGPTVIEASIAGLWRFLGGLFACLFWNGIVSVFVYIAIASIYTAKVGPLPAWAPSTSTPAVPLGGAIGMLVFMIPFVLIGLYLAACVVLSVCGVVRVKLDGMRGSTFVGIGILGWTKRFDIDAVTGVQEGKSTWQGEDKSHLPLIELMGAGVKFGTQLRPDQRRWMIGMLRVFLLEGRPGRL